MGGVAVHDWGVAFFDGAWVVDYDDLGHELLDFFGWVDEGVTGHEPPLDLVDLELDVETDVISWHGGLDLLVVHLDGLHIGFEVAGGEDHVGFLPKDSGLDAADCDGTVALDLVHIVDRDSERLLNWSPRGLKQINSLNQARPIIPRHILGLSKHILPSPPRKRHKLDPIRVVADLLQV